MGADAFVMFYDTLALFGRHVLPTFAQLIAVAMAVVAMMTVVATAKTAYKDFAEYEQSNCLPEGKGGESEDAGH